MYKVVIKLGAASIFVIIDNVIKTLHLTSETRNDQSVKV